MFQQRWKEAFDRDGFVVVRSLLGADGFKELTANLDRYIRDLVPTLPPADAFYDDSSPPRLKQMQYFQNHDPFFAAYVNHPAWSELAVGLLGEPAASQGLEWFCKGPSSNSPTPPHQDNFYLNLNPPSTLTIWLALDRVTEENGCLRYVRGSHRRPVRPHAPSKVLGFSQAILDYGPADEADEVPILLAPGDVAVHHGNTIHRADGNRSAHWRRAFVMAFKGASAVRDEAAFARYRANAKKHQRELGVSV